MEVVVTPHVECATFSTSYRKSSLSLRKSDIQCLTFMDFTLVRATCPLRHVIVSHVSARIALFACVLLAFRRFDILHQGLSLRPQ